MTLNQRIQTLDAQHGQTVRAYEAIIAAAVAENRDISDAEQTALDETRTALDGLEVQRQRLRDAEAVLARNAVAAARPAIPADPDPVTRQRPIASQMRRLDSYPASDFTRMAIATAVAGPWNAAEYARMRWGDDELADIIGHRAMQGVTRAPTPPMGTNDTNGGPSLIRQEHLGDQFIEMLRPMLIATRMPSMRRLEFNGAGALKIPRQTSGVSGGYVGEGGSIRVQRLNFAQLDLIPSKLAVIVPTTSELLRRSDPSVEQLIRDDMLQGTAETIDRTFFSTAAATPAAPAGILNLRPQTPGGAITPPADPDDSNVNAVTLALKNMIFALRGANVPMLAPVWIMHARTKEYLRLLRTVQEIFAFKGEIDGGTLLGYPIIDSTNIAIPFPPGLAANTAYALIDSSQVIWADDMAPVVDASEHASIQSDDAPSTPPVAPYYSAFQNDMTFLRIRMSHTWARRHDVAVAWALTGE
jgi:HK97 family phage major capsid protein